MKGLAKISFRNGTALLPARTPYERELAIEHLDFSVRRNGCVRLEMDGHSWLVSLCPGPDHRSCATCAQPLRGLVFDAGDLLVCTTCACTAATDPPHRARSLFGFAPRAESGRRTRSA